MAKDVAELARPSIFRIRPYVPGKPIEEVERELGIRSQDLIKLASNENPAGPSPLAVAAMCREARRTNLYPDSQCYELKRALADHLGVTPGHIIVGNGSDEVLKIITEAFLNPGEEVVYGAPTFAEYEFAARVMDGKTVEVPLRGQTYDLEAMAGRVTGRTKLVIICNPNNPTGTIVGREEVERFLRRMPEQVLTVFDEAYFDYVTSQDFPDTLEYVRQGRRVVVLRTFSKIYALAGLRVGYGVADPEIIDCLMRVREPFNVNSLAQAAALASLADCGHRERARQANIEGRDYLYRELGEIGLEFTPTQANFIFIRLPVPGMEVFEALLRRGVIVRPCQSFGCPEHIRVTIGTGEQNRRFIDALRLVLADTAAEGKR